LAQLNREVDKRGGEHEPQLSDLRDSGGLGQDADLVLFLQWAHRYDPNLGPRKYVGFVKKRRNGPIRKPAVVTTFNPERQQIGRPGIALATHTVHGGTGQD